MGRQSALISPFSSLLKVNERTRYLFVLLLLCSDHRLWGAGKVELEVLFLASQKEWMFYIYMYIWLSGEIKTCEHQDGSLQFVLLVFVLIVFDYVVGSWWTGRDKQKGISSWSFWILLVYHIKSIPCATNCEQNGMFQNLNFWEIDFRCYFDEIFSWVHVSRQL